jgi:hypothetical protein
VKSNNLKALELLAASATDEATKKDLLARSADLSEYESAITKPLKAKKTSTAR